MGTTGGNTAAIAGTWRDGFGAAHTLQTIIAPLERRSITIDVSMATNVEQCQGRHD